jgi:hypothetical protein
MSGKGKAAKVPEQLKRPRSSSAPSQPPPKRRVAAPAPSRRAQDAQDKEQDEADDDDHEGGDADGDDGEDGEDGEDDAGGEEVAPVYSDAALIRQTNRLMKSMVVGQKALLAELRAHFLNNNGPSSAITSPEAS